MLDWHVSDLHFKKAGKEKYLAKYLPVETPSHLFDVSPRTYIGLNSANSSFNAPLSPSSPCYSTDKLSYKDQYKKEKSTGSSLSPKLISHQHIATLAAFETLSIDIGSELDQW